VHSRLRRRAPDWPAHDLAAELAALAGAAIMEKHLGKRDRPVIRDQGTVSAGQGTDG
jgi:hypothetical protein